MASLSLRSRLSAAIARRPVLSACTLFSGKYTAADAMVQVGTGSEDSFDSARLGLFSGFGFYYGAVNYYVYRTIEKVPWGGGMRAAVGMSIFDIFIHLPFSFYPQFYLFRAAVFAEPRPSSLSEFLERSPGFSAAAFKTYTDNFVSDLKTLVIVFTPIDLASTPAADRTPLPLNTLPVTLNVLARASRCASVLVATSLARAILERGRNVRQTWSKIRTPVGRARTCFPKFPSVLLRRSSRGGAGRNLLAAGSSLWS